MKPNITNRHDAKRIAFVERNNYYYGKQFTVRDLEQEQLYLNQKRQLINRRILGWGVVCGLDVSWDRQKSVFIVQPGMALDCHGHEIVVTGIQEIPVDTSEQYPDPCRRPTMNSLEGGRFALFIEYEECKTEQVKFPAQGCDKQERSEFNRIREGVRFRIRSWEETGHKPAEEGIGCLDYFKKDSRERTRRGCQTKPLHHHLCSLIKEGCYDCNCGADSECDTGVILATFTAERADGNYSGQRLLVNSESIDACTDRRLVYGNSMLQDLIECYHGDLPRIIDFSWRTHTINTQEIDWEDFLKIVKEGLSVTFDQNMNDDSLNSHTFIVSFLDREEGTGSIISRRIPGRITMVRADDEACCMAVFVVDEDWILDELESKNSQLAKGVAVEIILRGSRIYNVPESAHHSVKSLDGEYLAKKLPTGNGTQGGDFIDWFTVRSRIRQ